MAGLRVRDLDRPRSLRAGLRERLLLRTGLLERERERSSERRGERERERSSERRGERERERERRGERL